MSVGVHRLRRRRRIAVVVAVSFVSPVVSVPIELATASGFSPLEDSWQPEGAAAPSVLAESTSGFNGGIRRAPLVAADPVRLAGGEVTFDTSEAVGKALKVSDTPLSVQVLRSAEVSKAPESLGADELTSSVKPVRPVTADDGSMDGVAKGELSVRVLSTDEAISAGFDGLAFSVDPRGLANDASDQMWLRFEIDWSVLKDNYGGEWESRLALVAAESCVLAPVKERDCAAPTIGLSSVVNDFERQVLVVEVELGDIIRKITPSSPGFGESRPSRLMDWTAGGSGFGLSAGASSAYGNYASTTLAGSGRWSVSGNSGAFNWSYPISGPSTPGGSASTSLDYSSSVVDGMTADENTQGGLFGVGWSMPQSYIERRYRQCSEEPGGYWANGTACWYTDNAVLSLNGVSGELVKDAANAWHLEDDPGWRISRFQGTSTQGSVGVDGDGEYWVVTTQDGTQYWFGFGKEKGSAPDTPGQAGSPGAVTKSVWTQPVNGYQSGEPCYGLSGSWCHQGYRWMLDRVVTATGITATYFYDTHINTFGRSATPTYATQYVAGGELVRIEYGQLQADVDVANRHPARIDFNYVWRCNTLSAACPQPTNANGAQFPDIPADEICGASATYCAKYAPTFFEWKVLTSITTHRLVNNASTAWYEKADEYRLAIEWIDNDDEDANNRLKLWLRSIEHLGWQAYDAGGAQISISMAKVWFDSYARLSNRSDYLMPYVTKQKYFRLSIITDDMGGRTNVTYSAEDPACVGVTSGWDTNVKRCFVRYSDPAGGSPGYARWHKYRVESVTVEDLAKSEPSITTTYTYDPAGVAWAHNDSPLVTAHPAWDEYRGYNWVETKVGTTAAAAITRSYFFRGMYGDKLSGGGTKTTTVTNSIGEVVNDVEWMRGRPYETQVKDSATVETKEFTQYLIARSVAGSGFVTTARRIQISASRSQMVAANKWTRSTYAYNAAGGLFLEMDYGEVANAAGTGGPTSEDTCTIHYMTAAATTEAHRFIEGLPISVTTIAGANCSTPTPTYLSAQGNYYDGAPFNYTGLTQMPTVGLLTRRTVYTATGVDPINTATYENNGFHATPGYARPITAIDARGYTTTTSYTPKTAGSVTNRNDNSITSTGPIAAHTATVYFDNFGRAWKTTDANGRGDVQCFDALGRTTAVYLADAGYTACGAGTPNLTYAYVADAVSASPRASLAWKVQTRSLFAQAGDTYNPTGSDLYVESWSFLDGQGTNLQTQTLSPANGGASIDSRIVVRSRRDSDGRTLRQSAPYAVSGTTFVYDATASTTNGLRYTYFTYDGLGRTTLTEARYGNGSTQLTAHAQYNTYNDSTLTTINHLMGAGTSNVGAAISQSDVLGRPILATKDNYASTTTFAYSNTASGPVVTSTDAGGFVTTTATDAIGRVRFTDDPDQGYTAFSYYPTGQPKCVLDAANRLRFFELDAAGRVTNERLAPSGTTACPTGTSNSWPLLSAFTYDPSGGIGATATATSYDGAGNAQVTASVPSGAFDARGRLTKTTVQVNAADDPSRSDDNELDAAFTTEQQYTRDGQVWRTIYPAMNFTGWSSNLASAETLTATFNTLGMPTRATSDFGGGFTYIDTTTFDPIARVTGRTMGGTGSTHGLQRDFSYRLDDGSVNAIASTVYWSGGSNIIQNDAYTYDAAGNPSKITRDPAGSVDDETECFAYDSRQRLSLAFTQATASGNCIPPGDYVPSGPAAYGQWFSYDSLDRVVAYDDATASSLAHRTFDTNGATVSGCSAGTDTLKPHAIDYMTGPTTSDRTFTYDCNGSRLTATNAYSSSTTSYTWDAHNHLTNAAVTISGSPGDSSANAYDASGRRALRVDTAANGDVTKTVYIGAIEFRWTSTTPTGVQALRTYVGVQRGYDGTLTWTADNTQGSVTNTATNAGVVTTTRYTPYGSIRSGGTTNGRGFLNQTTDAVIGLNYLDNRYLDPITAMFISVDPLVLMTSSPFLYANGTPTVLSDPSGLCPTYSPTQGIIDDGRGACIVPAGHPATDQPPTGPDSGSSEPTLGGFMYDEDLDGYYAWFVTDGGEPAWDHFEEGLSGVVFNACYLALGTELICESGQAPPAAITGFYPTGQCTCKENGIGGAFDDVLLALRAWNKGGGHHIIAKSLFREDAKYLWRRALAISDDDLLRLGVLHKTVSANQRTLYRQVSEHGIVLTLEGAAAIEVRALTKAGMDELIAKRIVSAALDDLLSMGVTTVGKIPPGLGGLA